MSVNRILCNHTNQARAAVIAASAQRPSTDIRLLGQQRAGGGRVVVGGAYTGAADTDIEVEVLSGTGGELTSSAPVIRGVGNGQLAVTAFDAAAHPETLTVALLDAGTPPEPALLEFFGATLSARYPGAGSNALALAVTRNLTTDPLPFATLEPIEAATSTLDGPAWDWGQPPATDAGVPAGALRVMFDGFPVVHRAWKTWEGGRFTYRIDPATPFAVPADTRILAVEGDYTLVLTDGTVTETYTAVTVYDFLAQIEARSALAAVRSAVAADRAPGGMAVTDIPLRTDAHALPTSGPRVEVLSVAPDAATQNITLEYIGTGAQVWSVSGGVSGLLPSATTGVLYPHGPVEFRIPGAVAASAARISATLAFAPRQQGEYPPNVCFKPLRLGAEAVDKTATFTYTERPPADCKCESMRPLRLDNSFLGLPPDPSGGDELDDPDYVSRITQLYAWREAFVRANTSTPAPGVPDDPAEGGTPGYYEETITGYRVFLQVVGSAGVVAGWYAPLAQFSTPFTLEASAIASAATFAVGRPVWGTATPSAQNMRTRNAAGAEVQLAWTGAPALAELSPFGTEAGTVLSVAAIEVRPKITLTWVPGTPGVPGAAGSPGRNSFLAETRDIEFADLAISELDNALLKIVATVGVSKAAALDAWDDLFTEVKADLSWIASIPQPDYHIDEQPEGWTVENGFIERYRAVLTNVLLLVGIFPNADASTTAGDGCWLDYPDETHWWVDESGEYLPAFTNKPYISAARHSDGRVVSTREFGFGIVTPCDHRLREGDRITIKITGTGQAGYKVGDKIVIPVVAAQSAPFVGGSDGDPTQTWTVRGTLSGALPDWLYHPAAPTPYAHGPATLTLAAGGIPWEVGDNISVSLEGGRLRWRRDGAAWSEGDLYGVAHALGDGLTLTTQPGAAPSFVAGDAWQFRALATYGVSRLRQPRIGQAFAWDGATVVLEVDLGSVRPLEAVLLALHTLPGNCVIAIAGGDAAPDEWTAAPLWHPNAVLAVLPAGASARYLRVSITGAGAGAAIGWLWAGQGWQPSVGASDLTLRRQYGLARGQGLNPAALYRGRGTGGAWRWAIDQGGALLGDNADALMALIDHTAENGMEPVCIVPDTRDPARAALAIIDVDEVVLTEHNNWQSSKLVAPAVSVELPFRAVIA